VIATSGHEDGTIKLWDSATGKQLRSLEGHTDDVLSIAFSPDGRMIASGSRDKTIKLWDVLTGTQRRSFEGHLSEVNTVVFGRDGKLILSGSDDGTMRLWRLESDRPLATLISLDKDDWVVFTLEGRFDASPGAEKLMHYLRNTPGRGYEIIPFDQLKERDHESALLEKLLKGEHLQG